MFEKLRFIFKKIVTPEEVEETYYEMREALRRTAIDRSGADTYNKRASATANLLSQLDNVDEASLRLGDVLVIKAQVNGKTCIIVETISPWLSRELETRPTLLHDPNSLFCLINSKEKQRLLTDKSPESLEKKSQEKTPIKSIPNETKTGGRKLPIPISKEKQRLLTDKSPESLEKKSQKQTPIKSIPNETKPEGKKLPIPIESTHNETVAGENEAEGPS